MEQTNTFRSAEEIVAFVLSHPKELQGEMIRALELIYRLKCHEEEAGTA